MQHEQKKVVHRSVLPLHYEECTDSATGWVSDVVACFLVRGCIVVCLVVLLLCSIHSGTDVGYCYYHIWVCWVTAMKCSEISAQNYS